MANCLCSSKIANKKNNAREEEEGRDSRIKVKSERKSLTWSANKIKIKNNSPIEWQLNSPQLFTSFIPLAPASAMGGGSGMQDASKWRCLLTIFKQLTYDTIIWQGKCTQKRKSVPASHSGRASFGADCLALSLGFCVFVAVCFALAWLFILFLYNKNDNKIF